MMVAGMTSMRMGTLTVCAGIIGALVYAVMIGVTLAHIQRVTGLVPFDMRPLGYSLQDAAQLLDALGEQGRGYYLKYQLPLDVVYPAMLAMTLGGAIVWFGRVMSGTKLVRIGVILSICSALFDYVENLCIGAMLLNWPDVPELLVQAASAATIAKSVATVLALLVTLFIGVIWVRGSHR